MKVSIITVCFNSREYIRQTIESVLNQSYKNIEYIIIDGGSTDGTVAIVKEYEKLFNGRLKWVSEKDNGIYDAMNKGIALATGDIIGVLNSDDWYENSAIEEVVKYAVDDQIIYGNSMLISDTEKILSVPHKNCLNYTLTKGMPFCHQAAFIPKSLYDQIGKYDTEFNIVADYDFIYRCIENNIKFIYIDSILVNFRLGGISDRKFLKSIVQNCKVRLRHKPCYVVEIVRVINYSTRAIIFKYINSIKRRGSVGK